MSLDDVGRRAARPRLGAAGPGRARSVAGQPAAAQRRRGRGRRTAARPRRCAGGGGPDLVQPLRPPGRPRRPAPGCRRASATTVAVLVAHVRGGLEQLGVHDPGQRRAVAEPAPGLEQPVQPAPGRDLGGQRVVGVPCRRPAGPGWATSGHSQVKPVGLKSRRSRHPGQQGPRDGDPTDAVAAGRDDLHARARRRRTRSASSTSSSAACRSKSALRAARWPGPAGRSATTTSPSRLATWPGHHGGQLGPAVQPGVGQPQPDLDVAQPPGRRGWSPCRRRAASRRVSRRPGQAW